MKNGCLLASIFHYVEWKGTRTGAGVNGVPVALQSRTPTKREREFESLRGYLARARRREEPLRGHVAPPRQEETGSPVALFNIFYKNC